MKIIWLIILAISIIALKGLLEVVSFFERHSCGGRLFAWDKQSVWCKKCGEKC